MILGKMINDFNDIGENHLSTIARTFVVARAIVNILNNTCRTANVK